MRSKTDEFEAGNCELHEITKYNVNVAIHKKRLDFKYVHAEESWTCQKKCFPASDKNLSNSLQMLA